MGVMRVRLRDASVSCLSGVCPVPVRQAPRGLLLLAYSLSNVLRRRLRASRCAGPSYTVGRTDTVTQDGAAYIRWARTPRARNLRCPRAYVASADPSESVESPSGASASRSW